MIKLMNITNIDSFFDMINSCKGSVHLISNEGDRLNLKSKLCQIVMISKVFSEDYIHELSLDVEQEEDKITILKFMMNNK